MKTLLLKIKELNIKDEVLTVVSNSDLLCFGKQEGCEQFGDNFFALKLSAPRI